MKKLRSILVITSFLTLSFTIFSSFSQAKQATTPVLEKDLNLTAVSSTKTTNPNPLHGDVWFAFTAIGVIGTYLAFKK